MELEPCYIGQNTGDQCHQLTYTKRLSTKSGLKSFSQFTDVEKDLIFMRSEVHMPEILDGISICLHHNLVYLQQFPKKFTKCINVFQNHKLGAAVGQREVSQDIARKLNQFYPKIKPGHKLCNKCFMQACNFDEAATATECTSSESDEAMPAEQAVYKQKLKESTAHSLEALNQSPLVLHSMPKRQKIKVVQRKVEKAKRSLGADMAMLAEVEERSVLEIEETHDSSQVKKWKKDSLALESMMGELKIKYDQPSTSYTEKIQSLTLKPKHWTIQQTYTYFNCSRYAVLKANTLKKESGILSKPERKIRTGISDETKNNVLLLFQDDEMARPLSGKKDFLSVGKKNHQQKRLLMCTLKELFTQFQKNFPTDKICLASFCTLRPKWCVPPGSSGTHNVCVCSIHQNAVLLSHSCLNLTYGDMIEAIVCSRESKMCMVHRCPDCPGKDALTRLLNFQFKDYDEEDIIHFQQWESTDRTQINNLCLAVNEFIELVAEKMDQLTAHSFIAKSQAAYLRSRKEGLKDEEGIALVDFAENFEFVIQDEAQGYHWCKIYCTVHPAVLYIKQDGKLKSVSFCVISDDVTHDTSFVWQLQNLLCKHIQQNFPTIKSLEYFSDGCAAQYKNYKNFLNLSFHKDDFSIDATWSFFATSHGKSPCDGIGGVVKRKLSRESLTRFEGNQILSSLAAYDYCKNKIDGITFFHVRSHELVDVRKTLEVRYLKGNTIQGTRSFHHFLPIAVGAVGYKRTSFDEQLAGSYCFFASPQAYTVEEFSVGMYIACSYDSRWWVGCIEEIDSTAGDIKLNFLHNETGWNHFSWPRRQDVCWVPLLSVLLKLEVPCTANGRHYTVTTEEYNALLSFEIP